MKSSEIRNIFLNYFADKNHQIIESSPLVPLNDPTLMFTNSGMVQFKDVFLGTDKRPYSRATSCQACLRAGGKHNDLENVGFTSRHHTFFEMLGNWSFGDYFKQESIVWGWDLLTKIFKLDPDRLLVTVYYEDDESYKIWNQVIGVSENKIIRIDDNKGKKFASDNFWMMADTGPCGPCTEIYYDHGEQIPGGPPDSNDAEGDRFVEIWNLVFMQYDIKPDGSVSLLPTKSVDTGMGLERMAAILQGKTSNYQIDLFTSLINTASEITQTTDVANISSPSLKVLADHIRATAFLIIDGVYPSNEGRGYVLRRITRRAIRHGYKLGARSPFFYKLLPTLVEEMSQSYPQLAKNQELIKNTIYQEESKFFQTLASGMKIIEQEIENIKKNNQNILNGEVAFRLHDTYGFPLDLTQDLCRESNIQVDIEQFTTAMNLQINKARDYGKFKLKTQIQYQGEETQFCGYQELTSQSTISGLFLDNQPVDALSEGVDGIIILDKTPFYAEAGGQVGDQGIIFNQNNNFNVIDTQKINNSVYCHFGRVESGSFVIGNSVTAEVNFQKRVATMRNHSVTHIMHKALRDVLGSHILQKGSLVDSEKTRFDFSHPQPVTKEEITGIEKRVNAEIIQNSENTSKIMPIDEAKKTGAVMLFGEKYDQNVRVVSIGSSIEFCGGTHTNRSGDIGLFVITHQSAVAAGIRRIEALTGINAIEYLQYRSAELSKISDITKTADLPGKISAAIKNIIDDKNQLTKENINFKAKFANIQSSELINQSVDFNGIKVLAAEIENADNKTLRQNLDYLKDKLSKAIIVLASVENQKVNLIAGVTNNLIDKYQAGKIINQIATQVGGKGGGRDDMAMAGGNKPDNVKSALNSLLNIIQNQ